MVDDLADGADGIQFDEVEGGEVSTASEADLSRTEPTHSPIGSQVEGSLCSIFLLNNDTAERHNDSQPNTSDATPGEPATLETTEVEEGSTTAEVEQTEGEDGKGAVTRSEGEVDAEAQALPRSPVAGAGLKRVREEEEVEDDVGHMRDAVTALSEWKRIREEGSTSAEGTSTPLSSSSVFLPTLLPPSARLLPFSSHTSASAASLTPYRALSTRSGASSTVAIPMRSVAQALTSPMRFATSAGADHNGSPSRAKHQQNLNVECHTL